MLTDWKPLALRGIVIVSATLCTLASCSDKDRHLVARDEDGGNGGTPQEVSAAGGVDAGGADAVEPIGGAATPPDGAGATPAAAGRATSGGSPAAAGTGSSAGSAPIDPTPQTIVSATQQPSYLQLAAGFGYFSDASGRVRRVALPDGTAIEELGQVTPPTGSLAAPPLAVHGDSAYVATSPSAGTFAIFSLSSDGGAPMLLVTTPAIPTAIAADDTYVYYAAAGNVTRVTIADKMPSPLAADQGQVSSLVLDADNVYWTAAMKGSVGMVPIDTGTPTPLATSQMNPAALVLDADNAYWIDQAPSAGKVMSAPLAGGAPTPLASGQAGPLALAINDSDAYFTNQNGTVMKVPLDGSAEPAQIASGQGGSPAIAVDGDKVYWINGTNGSVMALAL